MLTEVLATAAAAAIWGWIQWRYDKLVLTDLDAVPRGPSPSCSARASGRTAG